MPYKDYQKAIKADISATIAKLNCQPVLFGGTGLSIRYFGAPSWQGLLEGLAEECPHIDKKYAYYAQACSSSPQIASVFADAYREWAWNGGQNAFPTELFNQDVKPDAFVKHQIAKVISDVTPGKLSDLSAEHQKEIDALVSMQPHAVITTNYDNFLELVFSEYAPIVGQSALKGIPFTVGEIFKLHGSVDEPGEIVITEEDYVEFTKKKKFIAARLLSLFNEHPMLIAGYSAQDPNVCALLADIDEALSLPGELIDNIYFLEFDSKAEEKDNLPNEKLIQIEPNRSVRVKQIVASDFLWVFDAFKASDTLEAVPAKLMRAILARSYELVRSDVPRKLVDVDFDFLERKLETTEDFAKLLGITTISEPSQLSAHYRLSITELGQALGGKYWHGAKKIIKQIEKETGFDMEASDNIYHRKSKINKTTFSQYTDAALDLLKKVQENGYCDEEWLNTENNEPKFI